MKGTKETKCCKNFTLALCPCLFFSKKIAWEKGLGRGDYEPESVFQFFPKNSVGAGMGAGYVAQRRMRR